MDTAGTAAQLTRARGELPEPEEALLGIQRETPEQEAEREKTEKERAEIRRRFLIAQMENPLFREWLMEELIGLGTFENAFGFGPTGFPDPMATQFKLGMKAAGWHLWEIFDTVAPELASKMRREFRSPEQVAVLHETAKPRKRPVVKS